MNKTIMNTEFPIIQAPMNWLTNAKLAASVSNAGGLGVLGTNAGQSEFADGPADAKTRMIDEIQKTKSLTKNPFGINILTPEKNETLKDKPYTEALLESAFLCKLHYFVVVGVAHEEIFNQIKERNGFIIFRPLTPTLSEVKSAEKMGADLIVATGHDEGGILPESELGTFTIIPEIVDSVSIPVYAAGGINDRRSAKSALSLGASGIYVGTRFLASEEAPVADDVKTLITESGSHETVLVSGDQRSIATKNAKRLAQLYQQDHDTSESDRRISLNGGIRDSMLLGNIDRGIVTTNNGIGSIKSIRTSQQIINDFFNNN